MYMTCLGDPSARNACASPEAAVKCLSRETFSREMGSVEVSVCKMVCVKVALCKLFCV